MNSCDGDSVHRLPHSVVVHCVVDQVVEKSMRHKVAVRRGPRGAWCEEGVHQCGALGGPQQEAVLEPSDGLDPGAF